MATTDDFKYQSNDCYDKNATITSGSTVSAEIVMDGVDLCGLFMPAAFTGTSVKFQGATTSGGTYVTVTDGAGADYSVTVAASKYVPVDYTKLIGLRFLKLVSGASEGADRSIGLALRPI